MDPATQLASPQADPDQARRVRGMFDRIARRYTLIDTLTSFGRDAHWRREAVRLARVRPADRLLDACCGPGDLADAFAAARPAPAWIVGCDFSPAMLREAARRQKRRPRPIELVEADALHLPFPDESFELVSCAFGVRNLANVPAGLAEFVRVLAPAGRAVILEFSLPTNRLLRAAYRLYSRRVLPRVGGLISGQRAAYEYLPRSVEKFFSPSQLADMLRVAGLEHVLQRPLTMGVAVVTVGRKP